MNLEALAPIVQWAALISATVMATVGWIMQLVHYPAFRFVGPDAFEAFHRMHTRGISVLVGPAMAVELCAALGSVILTGRAFDWLGLTACIFAFAWTAAISGPIHVRLAAAPPEDRPPLVERLIRTNLPRTLAWTLHAIACLLPSAA
jgi:hypothetical protein